MVPMPPPPRPTTETQRRVRDASGELSGQTLQRLEREAPWFRALPAEDRSWVGLVAQAGIAAFVTWYEDPTTQPTGVGEMFNVAPPQLARSISLQQTLQLVRLAMDAVEERADRLAAPGQDGDLREALLRYSREVAFSAAEVYARAAEIRGAWDTRIEALVVDALERGDVDDSVRSRVTALGWSTKPGTLVMAGTSAQPFSEEWDAELRRTVRRTTQDALVGMSDDRLLLVLGGEVDDLMPTARSLLPCFSPRPVVVGHPVAGSLSAELVECSQSVREATDNFKAILKKYYMPFFKSREYIFEHYIVNTIYNTGFPFTYGREKNVYDNYVRLAAKYGMVKFLLVGMAGYHKRNFNQGTVVKGVSAFSRMFDHNLIIVDRVAESIASYAKAKDKDTLEAFLCILMKD